MAEYRNESINRLFSAITSIRTVDECSAFFEDLCTIREIQDMAQRYDTAILLDRGFSYQAIADEVGISTATISRVKRSLVYGSNGYRSAIDRMKETENSNDNP